MTDRLIAMHRRVEGFPDRLLHCRIAMIRLLVVKIKWPACSCGGGE
jgi:hypothetical protein